MNDYIAYAKYIIRHKWYVFQARKHTGASFYRCLVHDLSKLYPSEWYPYMHAFYAPDGSGRYEPTDEFDLAWREHQQRNKHHWQYWLLIEDSGEQKALIMPIEYVKEMVAGWIGAGIAINGKNEVKKWYGDNKDKMILHYATRAYVEDLVYKGDHE